MSIAIPGMTNLGELEENVQVSLTFNPVSTREKAELFEAAEGFGREFCRNRGYCVPCPEGIRIPMILRYLGYYKTYGLEEWAGWRYGVAEVKADSCIKCGECEEKCPYGLNANGMLKGFYTLLAAKAGSR